MSEPRPEAVAAAHWWTDTIAGPVVHDVGTRAENALYGSAQLPPAGAAWTSQQRDAFQNALATRLEQFCAGTQWRPDDPTFDSDKRIIWCDYGPDDLLVEAARAAGLNLRPGDVPSKTSMRIYPGEVRASVGYNGRPATIWGGGVENAEARRG